MDARIGRWLLVAAVASGLAPRAVAEPRFDGYEIRVIRPRYVVKAGKFELGGGVATIVNNTFIYTVMATGLLSYHFTDELALEVEGGYGLDFDREDKRILNDDFAIKTILLRPQYIANARLVWTPSYGKFALTSTRTVYFDTDVSIGGGTTGISYKYDYCDTAAPAPMTKSDPTVVLGLSQRYFLSPESALRIGIEDQRVFVDTADQSCTPDAAPSATASHDNLLLFLAWSHFL